MSRLVDRVLASAAIRPAEKILLRESVIVCADNVAAYFYEATDRSEWSLHRDFPNIAPPFPKFFVEFKAPARIWGSTWDLPCDALGIFFEASEIPQDDSLLLPHGVEVPAGAVRWLLTASPFIEGRGRIVGPRSHLCIPVASDGAPFTSHDDRTTLSVAKSEDDDTAAAVTVGTLVLPALLAVCFMHCKNVTIRAVDPKQPSRRKPAKGKDRRSLMRYHVLDIEPMTLVLREAAAEHKTGIRQAVHICRGHFKDYRQSGVFGKHKGLYWWDAHVRGNADRGLVLKDYRPHPASAGEVLQ